jgi:hypothetical protein
LQLPVDARDDFIMFKHTACCDVGVASFDRFVQIATISYKILESVLGQLIRSAIGVRGEVLKFLF